VAVFDLGQFIKVIVCKFSQFVLFELMPMVSFTLKFGPGPR